MKSYRRIYAVPDIHGRSDLLKLAIKLMEEDGFDHNQDLFIVLGDMIDRGPDSHGVIQTLMDLSNVYPESVMALRGNHEDFAVNAILYNRGHEIWDWNGGINTKLSYPNGYMSMDHARWLAFLPTSFEANGFFFSHAPVPRESKRRGTRVRNFSLENYGDQGTMYTTWEKTWHYVPPECEKPGGYMDVHKGPLSNNGEGSEHLIGVCGHIHRLPKLMEVRIFPKYRMLDAGAGCMGIAPLAVHECVSNRTFYARPENLGASE